MRSKRPPVLLESLDLRAVLQGRDGRGVEHHQGGSRIFSQGEPANCIFWIDKGFVRLTCAPRGGREVTFAFRGPGAFLGEECLAGRQLRGASAIAWSPCIVAKIEREAVHQLIRDAPGFTQTLVEALVSQQLGLQQDLAAHLLSSSEKRLARLLLALEPLIRHRHGLTGVPRISQALLAEMVGTTRGRVSYFMNSFRQRGLIDYNGGLQIRRSRLKAVLS